jgi:glycine cleavage system aminomethyltransferase T
MSAEAPLALQHGPLEEVLRRAGAHMAERHGWLVAADFGSLASEVAVTRVAAGLADVSSIPKLELRGDEAALASLVPDPCGPARARDTWWCPLSPSLVLVLGAPGANGDVASDVLERAAGADVQVTDVTMERVALCVVGRAASEVLMTAGAQSLPTGGVRSESIGGVPTLVLHSSDRHWLLVAPAADAAELWLALSQAGAPLGLAYVGMDALQHLVVARER